MRYVIFDPLTGFIRAVITGDREAAELNVREGEAILEHAGFVAVRRHRVEAGAVVPIAA